MVNPPKAAFTLVELLVAMAIFAILLLLTLNVIDHTGSLSSGTMAKMEAARVARESLDLISRDLSGALLPYDRGASNSLQLIANPADLAAAYAQPHSLFWQAPLSRSADQGNLAMVGYFVLREPATDSRRSRFQLRRLYVEQADSNRFAALATNAKWYDELAPIFAASDESTANPQGYKGWVADGVLGIWIRCLDSQGAPILTNAAGAALQGRFDSRKAYRSTGYRFPASQFSALPPFVEVGLVTCSPSDVQRIKIIPSSGQSMDPDNFYQDLNTFVSDVRRQNPGVKTVSAYTRIIPLLTADH